MKALHAAALVAILISVGACATVAESPPVAAAPVAPAPLLDRELFFGDPEISGGQVSPDGKFITFVKPYNGTRNIWVKTRAEAFSAAKPLTAEKRPVARYFWSRDGQFVLYAQDKGGDENFHVYAVDPKAAVEAATGVPASRDLTPGEKVRAEILSVPKGNPDEIIIGTNERDPQVSDVYRLTISTGKRVLLLKNTENVAGYEVDSKGQIRLAQRTTASGGTELLKVEGEKLLPLYTCTADEACGVVGFHKDGKHAYLSSNKGEHDLGRLTLIDLDTANEVLVEEDPEKQVDLTDAMFSDVTDELVATMYLGDRLRVYPKNDVFAKDLAAVRKALPEGEIRFQSSTADENTWLVGHGTDVDPGAVYVYERASGKVELLYRPRPNLPSAQMAKMEPVRITTRDGVKMTAYLTKPLGAEAAPLPAVLLVHGGPWARDTWGFSAMAQFLANRGYVVLQPNFRGSTGYGKKFINLGNGQWGTGTMQHDLTDAVQFLIKQGIADPKRVAIMGGSYGGYATLAGLAFTPEVYAAGVDIVGPSNIVTLLNSIPPYWAPMKKVFAVRVGDMEVPADLERLKKQSPLFSADKITAPLLVIQGQNDPRVKRAEADQIVIAMRDLKRPVEYLVAPDEGHGFQGKENKVAMFVSVEKFLAKHLGGRAQTEVPEAIAAKLTSLMIDPATVTMVAAAPAVPLAAPVFNGANFKPAPIAVYRIDGTVGGQAITGTSDVKVKKAATGWEVTTVDKLPMGNSTDVTTLSLKTLLPSTRTMTQGPATVKLAYETNSVKGSIDMGGRKMEMTDKSDRTVVTDGFSLALAVSTLPLAAGYTAGVGSFDPSSGKVAPFVLAVKGTEAVTVPAGKFDAFRVEIAHEGASDLTTVWVENAPKRRIVKLAQTLPMGQGSIDSVLLKSAAP